MRPALLVVDMQNDFIKGKSAYSCDMLTDKIVSNARKLIEACRKKRIPVIYTQHTIKKDKSNAEPGEPKDVRACIEGTSGWEIIAGLKPKKDDVILRKDKFDAFLNTSLDSTLKKLKADTVILCGVQTNNCVRATAEHAYANGYRLIFVPECCAATAYVEGMSNEETSLYTLKEIEARTYDTKLVQLKDIAKVGD